MTARCTATSKSPCSRRRRWPSTQCAPSPWRGCVYGKICSFFFLPSLFCIRFNASCDILEISGVILIEGIRQLTGFTTDGLRGPRANLRGGWQSCCSVVLLMASILSIPQEHLSLEELSAAAAVTLPQTQHYHHAVTLHLHWHMLLLIQICMNSRAGDSVLGFFFPT